MAGFTLLRSLLLLVGTLMFLAGLVALTAGGIAAGVPALWLIGAGGVLMVAAVLERTRYRSAAAERSNEPAGPGGGETPGVVESRFRPTDEVFVDPTTGRRMRVLLDAQTGERRYVAEA